MWRIWACLHSRRPWIGVIYVMRVMYAMHVYMHVCLCLRMCVQVVYAEVRVSTHYCTHVYIYIYIYIYVFACANLGGGVYMCNVCGEGWGYMCNVNM